MTSNVVIAPELAGVWVASRDDILKANCEAMARGWGARFAQASIARWVDSSAANLVIPLFVNHPASVTDRSYRCIVSVKKAGAAERLSIMVDMSRESILGLRRPTEAWLHVMVRALVEAQLVVNLDGVA